MGKIQILRNLAKGQEVVIKSAINLRWVWFCKVLMILTLVKSTTEVSDSVFWTVNVSSINWAQKKLMTIPVCCTFLLNDSGNDTAEPTSNSGLWHETWTTLIFELLLCFDLMSSNSSELSSISWTWNTKNKHEIIIIVINWTGAWSYFSKFSFLFHLNNHHSKNVNLQFQISVETVKPFESKKHILQFAVSYWDRLNMVTITKHIFV